MEMERETRKIISVKSKQKKKSNIFHFWHALRSERQRYVHCIIYVFNLCTLAYYHSLGNTNYGMNAEKEGWAEEKKRNENCTHSFARSISQLLVGHHFSTVRSAIFATLSCQMCVHEFSDANVCRNMNVGEGRSMYDHNKLLTNMDEWIHLIPLSRSLCDSLTILQAFS